MNRLAEITKSLLNIDPRKSSQGIVLHVKREDPEWLKWSARHTFNDFLLEVLYKIDSDEIAIYPGNHVIDLNSNPIATLLTMNRRSQINRRQPKGEIE